MLLEQKVITFNTKFLFIYVTKTMNSHFHDTFLLKTKTIAHLLYIPNLDAIMASTRNLQ